MAALCLASLLLPGAAFASKETVPDWVRSAIAQPITGIGENAKAVVLLDDTTFTVGADGKAVEHRRHVVKILRPNGREDGIVRIWFDNDSKLLSLHVWSVGPDGQEYAVKDKDILEQGASNSGPLYVDERCKTAEPPGRDPGGVIAYEYEQRQPYYQHEADWFFQGDIPHLHQSFTLELPPGFSYSTVWAHHKVEAALDLEHQRTRWEIASVPQIDLEHVPLAPSMGALQGRMTVHYGPSGQVGMGTWQEVGAAYDAISRDRMVANPEIAAKAAQLTAGKTDFYDKAEAIAEFVQKDIRYFVVEQGIGGIQPHAAADIFRNRYGDCKDKSTLLSAMLASVGIHSDIVIVDTNRGFIDPKAPSAMGNHAIGAIEIPASYNSAKLRSVVTAKSGKRYLIVDPTWTETAFGQLEHNLQGGYGVLIEGANSEIVQFPVLSPELNSIHRSATFALALDGGLKGSITEQRFGDVSEHMRRLYTQGDAKQQETYLDRRLSQDFTSFSVSDFKIENVAALNKPVTTTFTISAERYGRSMGPLLMVRPRVIGSEGFELDRKHRKYPIDLGETMLTSDDYTITVPEGYAIDELPEPVKMDVGFAAYESSSRLDGNALHYTRTYTVREVSLPADRYDDVQKLAAIIEADEQNHAVFKKK